MTVRYRHIPTEKSYWVYERNDTGEIQAEEIGTNHDKMLFESWDYPEKSEYWEKE